MSATRRRSVMTGLLSIAPTTILVSGCSEDSADPVDAGGTERKPDRSVEASKSDSSDERAADQLLEPFGLAGLGARELIGKLEETPVDERPEGLAVSVRSDHVELTGDAGTATLPIDGELMYVAFAPYRETTHDCFYHNPVGCVGELRGESVHVRITDASGSAVVDEDVTTPDNGFIGVWLARGAEYALEVETGSASARADLGTNADSATCLTTIQLS